MINKIYNWSKDRLNEVEGLTEETVLCLKMTLI